MDTLNIRTTTKPNKLLIKFKSLGRKLWKSRKAYIMLTPIFLCLAIFNYYPPIMGAIRSFYDWSTTGKKFVGFDNYIELFSDKIFINSLKTLFCLTWPRLLISMVVPFVFAEMIFAVKNKKLQYFYRVLIVLPLVTPGIVNTYIWKFIYEPMNGLAITILKGIGIIDPSITIDWLNDGRYVIGSIVFMGFPWVAGTAVLIYLAGLNSISESVFESCKLEGCGIIKRILLIDIPLSLGQIKFFLIVGLIALIQEFGTQLILTQGGPGYDTWVPGWHLYQMAFTNDRMGYACAIGMVMFVFLLGVSIAIRKLFKTEEF